MSEVTNPLYGRFTEVVDNLANAPTQAVDAWSSTAQQIFGQADLRLDANAYHPSMATALNEMAAKGIRFGPLVDFASVSYRPRFARVWARDADNGVPYFNVTDLLSIFSLGFPSPQRYLSFATKTDIDRLIVREGWLLMASSGTVGRVFYVPERLDGWAATHDIMRIVAKDTDIAGYLYAWLSTPMARAQIEGRRYSTQIDHLTDSQVADIPVPHLPDRDMSEINKRAIDALTEREAAIERLAAAWTVP